MKIKSVTYYKEYKIGLPHFSNSTASMGMTVELGEDEKPNHEVVWDEINRQIQKEAGDLDPAWIRGVQEKATKEFTKTK